MYDITAFMEAETPPYGCLALKNSDLNWTFLLFTLHNLTISRHCMWTHLFFKKLMGEIKYLHAELSLGEYTACNLKVWSHAGIKKFLFVFSNLPLSFSGMSTTTLKRWTQKNSMYSAPFGRSQVSNMTCTACNSVHAYEFITKQRKYIKFTLTCIT